MSGAISNRHIGIAIGSPRSRVCSVGAFARAEGAGFTAAGWRVTYIEPNEATWEYPLLPLGEIPPYIFVHMPSLFERRRPWNALVTMASLRARAPRARILYNVHEYAEAPAHWMLRARMAAALSHGLLVNTHVEEKMLSPWKKPLFRHPLGPTLWNDALFVAPTASTLAAERALAMNRLEKHAVRAFLQSSGGPLLVHGGMITEGKGIEFLERWCTNAVARGIPFRFLLMGGLGPKERDKRFAQERVSEFQKKMGLRFFWLQEPHDDVYRDLLIAADGVVLPFEQGLSERRSTFLSSCSSGAAVWATVGRYTSALQLPADGPWLCPLGDEARAFESLNSLVRELTSGSGAVERRLKNVAWARTRAWSGRVAALEKFLSGLS